MNMLINNLKRHAKTYYLYYALSYLLIFPLLLKLLAILFMANIDVKLELIAYGIGNLFIVIAGGIKHNTKLPNVLSKIILLAGTLLAIYYCAFILHKNILLNSSSIIWLLVPIAITVWLSFLFYVDLSVDNKLITRSIINKLLYYYAIIAIMLYITVIFVGKYYSNKIDNIISKGSYYRAGGLNYKQIDALVESTKHQSAIVLSITIFLYLLIFFIAFTLLKNKAGTTLGVPDTRH